MQGFTLSKFVQENFPIKWNFFGLKDSHKFEILLLVLGNFVFVFVFVCNILTDLVLMCRSLSFT